MSQITLRGLEPKIEREIRRIAKKTGKSLNRVVLEMINKSAEPAKAAPADSLRNLAGGWTEKEASEFNEAIKICRQIDEVMWK
jgi:protein-disulfide isomerase